MAEQEEKTLREIEDYAKEKSSKKVSGYKYEAEDIGEASIEEYFDAQMFQSKWFELSKFFVNLGFIFFLSNACLNKRK